MSIVKCLGHSNASYPNKVVDPGKSDVIVDVQNDGFMDVTCKGDKGKNNSHKADYSQPKSRPVGGIRLNKPNLNFYHPVAKPTNDRGGVSTSGPKEQNVPSNSGPNVSRPNDKGKATTL